jgi:hypothetical protein
MSPHLTSVENETSAAALAVAGGARWGAAAALHGEAAALSRRSPFASCFRRRAGKTPTVIALARMARGRGLKPGLLASGYGGRAKAPVVVDASLHTAEQVGDEALLLAAVAPTVVARDRAEGARSSPRASISSWTTASNPPSPSTRRWLPSYAVGTATAA